MIKLSRKFKKLTFNKSLYKKMMKRKAISSRVKTSLLKRNRSEKIFKLYGLGAIIICCIFLSLLFFNIIKSGYSAFFQTRILVNFEVSEEDIESGNYSRLIINSLKENLPDNITVSRSTERRLLRLVSNLSLNIIENEIKNKPHLIGQAISLWLPASSDVDMYIKGKVNYTDNEGAKLNLNPEQIGLIDKLVKQNKIRKFFNDYFFTSGDSREPETAGILSSLVGSIFVVISCMLIAIPLGVLSAIYLEEFAKKDVMSQIIEVNINNLAAVPSIVFGLLGLVVYLQFMEIPRSASLAGGLTLALMALPIIVISTRTALRAVPNSIREAATALGASKLQTVFHHTLPLATPSVMTGIILSMARVLGETAPLIMIGMVAFIVDIPNDFLDPSTALPVQIFLWADSAEAGFIEKTSAAIIILLLFVACANAFAVYLRKKFEIRW